MRINNRQERLAYSARTDCFIINHYKNLFENEVYGIQGEYANYNCETLKMYNLSNLEVILNIDIPMTIINFDKEIETFDFSEINFNGNSVDESSFIQENTINLEKYGILKNTEVFVNENLTLRRLLIM